LNIELTLFCSPFKIPEKYTYSHKKLELSRKKPVFYSGVKYAPMKDGLLTSFPPSPRLRQELSLG
jgi:hypothetical protein